MTKSAAPQDSLLILPINAQQVHAMQIIGHNDLDKEELTGEKTTLII